MVSFYCHISYSFLDFCGSLFNVVYTWRHFPRCYFHFLGLFCRRFMFNCRCSLLSLVIFFFLVVFEINNCSYLLLPSSFIFQKKIVSEDNIYIGRQENKRSKGFITWVIGLDLSRLNLINDYENYLCIQLKK